MPDLKATIRDLLACAELNGLIIEPATKAVVDRAKREIGVEHPVVVVLRKGPEDDLFALFPELPANSNGSLCTCYSLVGQHSSADYFGCIENSGPATGDDAEKILRELSQVGYFVKVVKRATRAMHENRVRQY